MGGERMSRGREGGGEEVGMGGRKVSGGREGRG